MEIFGIGPLELLLIVLIALIVLGPKEMMSTAQKAATWLRKLRNSEIWSSTKEVMDIPNKILRGSGLDKELHELQSISKKGTLETIWQPKPLTDLPVAEKSDKIEETEDLHSDASEASQTTNPPTPEIIQSDPLENDK